MHQGKHCSRKLSNRLAFAVLDENGGEKRSVELIMFIWMGVVDADNLCI